MRITDNRNSRNDKEFVPDDAGEYTEPLLDIIQRMSTGYWPTIGVGKGWYPLIIDVNKQLTFLCSGYRIIHIGKDNGALQFHFRLPKYDDDTLLEKCIAVVAKAQTLSRKMCQVCGEQGTADPSSSGRFVLCEEHIKKVVRKRRIKKDEDQ